MKVNFYDTSGVLLEIWDDSEFSPELELIMLENNDLYKVSLIEEIDGELDVTLEVYHRDEV